MTLLHRVIQSPCCGDTDQLIMASVSCRGAKMTTKINYVWYNLLDWAEEKTWSCKISWPLGFDYGTRNIRHSTTTESTDSTDLHMIHKLAVDCVWNVMAHAQKPDFVFRRNGRVHLNRQGRQFSRLLGSRGVRICGSNDGYTMFRGSVKGTGYPLHSPVSPSLPLPCVAVCHHISTGLF